MYQLFINPTGPALGVIPGLVLTNQPDKQLCTPSLLGSS